MIPVLYTKTQQIRDNLDEFDSCQKSVASFPLDPKTNARLFCEGKAAKAYYALTLSSAPFARSEVVNTLLKKNNIKKDKEEISKYLRALDFVRENWMLNNKEFTTADCTALYKESCFGQLREETSDLKHILGYVQLNREHPLVKAALCYILCFKINPFTQNSKRFSHLLFDFFVVKEGADSKGFFCIDHFYSDHKKEFDQALDYAYRKDNLTPWLEYVTSCALSQMRFVKDVVSQKGSLFRTGIPKRYWNLTQRQQKIASFSMIPQNRITNKRVQELLGVSQITASRDLSKLAILGLLEQHGRGRSVYYR